MLFWHHHAFKCSRLSNLQLNFWSHEWTLPPWMSLYQCLAVPSKVELHFIPSASHCHLRLCFTCLLVRSRMIALHGCNSKSPEDFNASFKEVLASPPDDTCNNFRVVVSISCLWLCECDEHRSFHFTSSLTVILCKKLSVLDHELVVSATSFAWNS